MKSEPHQLTEEDCRSCGACCSDASDGRVLVSAEDIVRWKRAGRSDILKNLVPGHFGEQGFAADDRGRCLHLGKGDPRTDPHARDCQIYGDRGYACRSLQPGTWQCLAYRKEFLGEA